MDDQIIVPLFFAALAPAELDIYERVLGSFCEEHEQIHRARQQEWERLRYQARLAERQFQKTDPDNRLVAAELEKRWEIALRELIQKKQAGQPIQVPQWREPARVINLMDALRRSVEASRAGEKPAAPSVTSRRAKAERPTARSRRAFLDA